MLSTGKKAAPFHFTPEPSSRSRISRQRVSSPITLMKVERSRSIDVPRMSTSTTSTVKSPRRRYSAGSHLSNSAGRVSKIDKLRLRHVVLEQYPERLFARRGVPFLEFGQRAGGVSSLVIPALRVGGVEGRARDFGIALQHLGARLAVFHPAEAVTQRLDRLGNSRLPVLRARHHVEQRAHDVHAPEGEG